MKRAWRWYWSTVSASWAKMSPRQHRRMILVLVIALGVPIAVAIAAVLAPHARGPIIVGFVVLWLITHWSLTFVSMRRRRRARGANE